MVYIYTLKMYTYIQKQFGIYIQYNIVYNIICILYIVDAQYKMYNNIIQYVQCMYIHIFTEQESSVGAHKAIDVA